MSFELAWKVMKDCLNFQGYAIKSPREAIKKSFETDLLQKISNQPLREHIERVGKVILEHHVG